MHEEVIQRIIEFAIEKEQEAIDLYNDLAERVRVPALAEELRNLAKMEQGHREWLKNLDIKALVSSDEPPAQNLRIADYTVEAVPHDDMAWEDIISIAMHRELASMNLYNDLADSAADLTMKEVLQGLAAEELKHKLYLETIWDEKVLKDN